MNVVTAALDPLTRVVDLPAWTQALISAVGGAVLAWAFFFGGAVGPWPLFDVLAALVVALVLVPWIGAAYGRDRLKPTVRLGMRMMGLQVWSELALGAIGVAVAIWIAATIVPGGANPSDATKAVTSGWAAGFSAAVTAALAKRAEGIDDRIGAKIYAAVDAAYGGSPPAVLPTFPTNTDGSNAIYSDPYLKITGWGRAAREKRAAHVEAALAKLAASGASHP